jgi:hypothetical protein
MHRIVFALGCIATYLYHMAPEFVVWVIMYLIPHRIISMILWVLIRTSNRVGKFYMDFLEKYGDETTTCESIAR